MTKYEATLDLPNGVKIFAKAVVLGRYGENYETQIAKAYINEAYMQPKSICHLPDGNVIIQHQSPLLGNMKIIKVDKDTSMVFANGYDESLVDDAIFDLMGGSEGVAEVEGEAFAEFKTAMAVLKNAFDLASGITEAFNETRQSG